MRLPLISSENKIANDQHINDYINYYFGCSLAQLLEPIGDNQVGESVRHNGVYSKIKEARREDDPTLPQGVWTHELKVADWDQVETTAIEALCSKSKDLQLCVWLMESKISRYGFSGIAPAAVLLRALCETFWDGMHPQIIDNDIEIRTNPINWINEKLSLRLRLVPITCASFDGTEYSWSDWESAQRFEQLKRQHEGQINWEGVTIDEFKQHLSATPQEFLWQLCADIEDALQAIDNLIAWLDQTCGNDSPSLSEITTLAKKIYDLAESELAKRGLQTSPAIEMQANESDDGSSAILENSSSSDGGNSGGQSGGGSSGDGVINSRAEAFACLHKAAEFLMKDDPHSPVPYMVYTACSWGEKAAPDLYQELFLQKGGQLNIFEVMGLAIDNNSNE